MERKPNLLQLHLEFLILCYYGDLSLQIPVNRAIAEIWGANESEAGAVSSSHIVPQTCEEWEKYHEI